MFVRLSGKRKKKKKKKEWKDELKVNEESDAPRELFWLQTDVEMTADTTTPW